MAKDVSKLKDAVLTARASSEAYQTIKKKASNAVQSAPKATENTTTKGVANNTATPTSDVPQTKAETSKATKALSKVVNTVEKAKSAVSKTLPSALSLTGAANPTNNSLGDLVRTAFDSKNINKKNTEIPVLKNDTELINYYENLPKANALQRLTSFEKNNAYNQKQALTSQYREAKDKTVPTLLNRHGMTEDDLNTLAMTASLSNNPNYVLMNELKKKGISDEDAKYLRGYALEKGTKNLSQSLSDATGKNFATKTVGTLGSFALNPLESLINTLDKAGSYVVGNPIQNNSQFTQDIRESASKDLGNVGKFAYGVGTSIGDMGTAMLLGNATGLGSTLSSGLMGLEKASDVMNEGVDRNLTPDQIMAEGVASGITTALTEKIPMGKFEDVAQAGFKSTKGIAFAKELGQKIVASAIPEATQEAAEDIADAIADAIIAKDKSELNSTIRAYTATGLSHEEATAKAWLEFIGQVGMDALAGAISGGVVGGGNAVINGTRAKIDAQVNDAANRVIDTLGNNPLANINTEENVPTLEKITDEVVNNLGIETNANGANTPLLEDLQSNVGITEGDVNNNNVVPEEALLPEYANLLEELETESANTMPTNEELADRVMQSYNNGNAEFARRTADVTQNLPELAPQYNQTVNESIPNLEAPQNGLQNMTRGDVGSIKPPTPTLIEQKNNNGGKESRFSSNTLTNMPTFTQNEESAKGLKQKRDESFFNYNPITNKATMNDAIKNLEADFNGEFAKLNRQEELHSATDVAESMIILDLMQKEVLEGKRSASDVWEFAKQMQAKTTDRAQGLQMLSHFTRTASSTLMKIEKMRDIKSKNVSGKEANAIKKYSSVLERILSKIGYDGTMDTNNAIEKSYAQIHEEVLNTMGKEASSIFNNFTDTDIDYLATLIHQGASEKMIYDALCKKFATGYWDISEEDVKRVIEIFDEVNKMENKDSKEASELEDEAYALMAKYLGDASFKEKWNQWRYLAMLGNARTHARNMIGNFLFGTVTNVKDNMAGLMESALDSYYKNNGIERERAFVSKVTDGKLINAAHADFDKSVYKQASDNANKYSMDRDIEKHRKVFDNKALEKARKFNSWALDAEDTLALRNKYGRALASYLKANGKTESIFNSDNKSDIDLLKRARDFAVEQAKIATFHEDSSLANFLNGMSRAASASDNLGVKALGTAIEAVVPFKKTPINILKQGAIEYNPVVQIPKALAQTIKYNANNPNNQISMSDVIDTYCKGLSGAGILALGAWLASKGILKGQGKDEEDYAQGNQEYSVEWDFNGKHHSYTMDWAAPSALPLFMGAELYKWWNEDTEHTMGSFFDALASIGAPAFELSMLEGVNDAIKNFGKSTDSVTGVMSGVAGLGANYLSQAVPTLGGQIARTIDPTRRSTYTGQEYGGVADVVAKQGIKTLNKIPGLSYLSQPYVDTLGHEEQNDEFISGTGAFGRAIQNFLSPGYHSVTNTNPIYNELSNLSELAKEDGVDFKKSQLFPKAPDKSVDGHRLTPQEYTEASIAKGKTTEEALETLFNSESYKNASAEQKVEMVKDMLSKANQMYKYDEYGNEYNDKAFDIYDEKGVDGMLKWNEMKTTMDGSTSNAAKIEALNQADLSDEDLGYYASKMFTNPSSDAIEMQEQYGDIGLYYWYSIASQYSKKAERYDAVVASDLPNNVKESMLNIIGESGKKNKNTSESETTTEVSPQSSNTIPTLDEFIQAKKTGKPLPEVKQESTKKSSTKNTDISNMVGSANGSTWVDFTQAVPYLTSQNLSAEERGQAYYNTGDKSSGKTQVYNDMGYPGVAQYYENQYYADIADTGNHNGKKNKAELKSYLKAQGYSNEDIAYWMQIYGYKP